MKVMFEMIRYQYKQYMLSAKWVMPCVVLIGIFGAMYSMPPVEIVNSFSITGMILFCLMVWVGVTVRELEPEVSEQLIILRLKSERKYHLCHTLFVMCICAAITGISIVVPVWIHMLTGGGLFMRTPIWSDFVGGFLLMSSCAFVGGMVGEFFQIRIIRERGMGILLTFLVAVVAICRNGLVAKLAFAKYILWVIPPISDVASWFTNEAYYDMGKVMVGFLLLLFYGIVLAVAKAEWLRRVKF